MNIHMCMCTWVKAVLRLPKFSKAFAEILSHMSPFSFDP